MTYFYSEDLLLPYKFSLTDDEIQGCMELADKVKTFIKLPQHSLKTIAHLIFNSTADIPSYLELHSQKEVLETFPQFQAIYEKQIKPHVPIHYDFDTTHSMYCSSIRNSSVENYQYKTYNFTVLLVALSPMHVHSKTSLMSLVYDLHRNIIHGETFLNKGDCLYIKPNTTFWVTEKRKNYMFIRIDRKPQEVKTWLGSYYVPDKKYGQIFIQRPQSIPV